MGSAGSVVGDWRDASSARSLATLYAPDSFASRCLADVKTGVCLWLSFAVDPVAGGAGPLAVALAAAARGLNQETSSASAVGWAQSNGGGAVASALVGKTTRGRDSHVAACGDRPGAQQAKEYDLRVASPARQRVSETFRKGDVPSARRSDVCVSSCRRTASERITPAFGRRKTHGRRRGCVRRAARRGESSRSARGAVSRRLRGVRATRRREVDDTAFARLVPFPVRDSRVGITRRGRLSIAARSTRTRWRASRVARVWCIENS